MNERPELSGQLDTKTDLYSQEIVPSSAVGRNGGSVDIRMLLCNAQHDAGTHR